MRSARSSRSEEFQQFLIPCPRENVWSKGRELEKQRFIEMITGTESVMGKKKDNLCMEKFLNSVKSDGVLDPGLTPYLEFLLRSAPLVDYLIIGMATRAGWIYPSSDTIYGIQSDCGLSYKMLKDIEVQEIIAGKSTYDKIAKIRDWME